MIHTEGILKERDHLENLRVVENNIQINFNKTGLQPSGSRHGPTAFSCEQEESSGAMMSRELLVCRSYRDYSLTIRSPDLSGPTE
jgi:hypothetical protein